MKVLIVSITAGNGHNATAESVADEFERLRVGGADIEVAREDFLEYVGNFFYNFTDKGYTFLTLHFPELFGRTYDLLEHNEPARRVADILLASDYISSRFGSYFRDHMPDVIVSTHYFAASALSKLKGEGRLSMPIIGINTDYCLHPFWEDFKFLDYLVTADPLLTDIIEKRGIERDRILPFGLPVRRKFLTCLDKAEARELLSLDLKKRTVLVMGGSMGYGDIEGIVTEILAMDGDYQVVAICGNNKQLLKSLHKIDDDDLHCLGFVNNVELYMDAADCIVTKPGGLTSTEFLAKNLPAILVNPIPGPEQRNMQFLCNSGCAMHAGKNFTVSEALRLMFDDPYRLPEMRAALKRYSRPDSAARICEFAIRLCEGFGVTV
ncbi:MAG: galactosyldiacylglycerol synthase [Oscillospiraceae bacterium]|nr:galactosyldiacylglycerol synthase [Oscillospiraceae bacterium]